MFYLLAKNRTLKKINLLGILNQSRNKNDHSPIDNFISSKGAIALGVSLEYNPVLEEINFDKNNIGMKGALAIAKGVIQSKGKSGLKTLSLSNVLDFAVLKGNIEITINRALPNKR